MNVHMTPDLLIPSPRFFVLNCDDHMSIVLIGDLKPLFLCVYHTPKLMFNDWAARPMSINQGCH